MSAKPYDQAFKYLAEQDPESLLILLGFLQPGQQAHVELLPREVSVSALLPDQPYLVETEQGSCVVHIEAQTIYDPLIPERMAEYGARLWVRYRLPVSSYVLLLTRKGLPERAPTRARVDAGDVQIRVHYRLVKLWNVSARRVLAMDRESLLPFVPLMRGGQAELEIGAQRLSLVRDERKQQELGLHFLLLGGLRYNREDILELIGSKSMIPLEQLKESSVYQLIVEEGLKEGRRQGEVKGRAETLRRLVEKRFPGLNVASQIERIGDAQVLQELILEVTDMTDGAALEKRLAQILNP